MILSIAPPVADQDWMNVASVISTEGGVYALEPPISFFVVVARTEDSAPVPVLLAVAGFSVAGLRKPTRPTRSYVRAPRFLDACGSKEPSRTCWCESTPAAWLGPTKPKPVSGKTTRSKGAPG
jgi:hypothetical protein